MLGETPNAQRPVSERRMGIEVQLRYSKGDGGNGEENKKAYKTWQDTNILVMSGQSTLYHILARTF